MTDRVAFLGSKNAGLHVLRALLDSPEVELAGVACPDDGDDERSRLQAFEACCAQHGVPLAVVHSTAELDERLKAWRPQLAVVCGWYQRIAVERHPSVGFFGFHASPLPRYRGGAPLPWQIINGEPSLGLSFFELVAGLDEGRIVAQADRPLASEETIADALAWVEGAAPELLVAHLPALLRGDAPLREQEHRRATYCSQRTPADGLIDWRAAAGRVHDFVRAQTRPYPGAFTRLPDGRVLRVWRTSIDPRRYLGPPGAVCERHPDRVVVTCGEGAIALLEAGIDGDPPDVPVRDILDNLAVRLT
jgi:methionyl-tRNA formyltransferase